MNIPILETKDDLVGRQDVAVVVKDVDGNCKLVETTPAERQTIARKLASNRQWQSKRYVMHDIVMINRDMANRMYEYIEMQAERDLVAKAIIADILGVAEEET